MSNLGLAIARAKGNTIQGLPRMASVLSDGRSFFIGLNSRKTHPLQKRFTTHPERICTHAEIAAIALATKTVGDDLSSFLLSVARVQRNGTIGLAQPCPGCMRAIKHFKIKHVEWT